MIADNTTSRKKNTFITHASSGITKEMLTSLICYLFPIGAGIFFGLLYVFTPDLLSYHLNAIGVKSMSHINERYAIMLRTFKFAAGLGMLSNAVSMIILLMFQIKRCDLKYKVLLFTAGAPYWFALFFNVLNLEINTNAGAPMIPNLIVAVCSLLGFMFALFDKSKKELNK